MVLRLASLASVRQNEPIVYVFIVSLTDNRQYAGTVYLSYFFIFIFSFLIFYTGPALIAVFFLKTEAAILHKYV